MNKHKLNILFVISVSRTRIDNRAPLSCRLTYNKERKSFAVGQFINPKNWDSKKQLVKPPEPDRDNINQQLSLIKTKINRAFLLLQIQERSFTVNDIYNAYLGKKATQNYSLIEFYENYLNKLKTLVGIDIKQVTYNKFEYIKNDVKSYIKWKYKTNDIRLKELKPNFLTELEYYYKTQHEPPLKQVTINKKIQRLRKVVRVAVAEDFLEKDPFLLYKAKNVTKQVVFLSSDELQKLESYNFKQQRLNFIRDLFIFCCYTGLPYNELMKLKAKHLVKGFDNNLWIKIKRDKTLRELSVPLLPKAEKILTFYQNKGSDIFPRISNQRYNSYLKEIASIVGIDKNLTTHMARRTFASTVLLYNNVPIEIVSELLGHSNIKIMQDSYGKVVQKRISLEIKKLRDD
ncbi:integrase [Tamlana nanhaiensis]|uniref:Integrase n=1 Tax=Neotamlana nanhaiensis TaxID=1382798 RepID=A0A0D7VWN9_9FLAO|nr:site-specific integrase [Tamlana nanhaiensis]KJD31234.1 integrase [Tamlana nanhaiensis]